MNSSRQEYPALLSALEPRDALNVLNDRVEVITRTNSDIADWLLERRKVEERYAQGLRKLAERPQRDGGTLLGIFQVPWQRIVESTESLAQSHESLAQKIEVDTENPLRQFVRESREMQSISTIQSKLVWIARDLDNAHKMVDKLKDKAGRFSSGRATNANPSTDDAQLQWESQAPYLFEQLQSLDEVRVNHLKDVLTQFQTHEVDSIEQHRKPAELCLNALLNIETADEIKTFVARVSTESRQAPLPRRRSSASNHVRRLHSSAGDIVPPMPPPPRLTSDVTRQGPGLSNENGADGFTSTSEARQTPKKQGLKSRLGTVMGRRKNAASSSPITSAEKPKKGRNRSSLMPFRRNDSARSQLETESTSMAGRPVSPAISRREGNRTESSMRPVQPEQLPSGPTDVEAQPMTPVSSAVVNGIISGEKHTHIDDVDGSPNRALSFDNNNLTRPQQPPHELSVTPPSPVRQTDAISRAQQEATTNNAENEAALKRLKIRDQPIPEDEKEAQQAMNKMTNQLRLQAQASGVKHSAGSMRGRRDVRNSVFVPNPEPTPSDDGASAAANSKYSQAADAGSSEGAGAGAAVRAVAAVSYADYANASPIKTPAITLEERTISDTTSLHSGQSLGTVVHHPEMHEQGLSSSIVETVSTWFSGGTVSESFVVGEIALVYNGSETTAEAETIRVENFHVLEKIAPNPSFVSAAGSEKGKEKAGCEDGAGQYSVALSAIMRSMPVVAFKYQLHVDPANMSAYSPVLFTPAWQIQDTQASVIVMYTLNPAFVPSAADMGGSDASITLKNVSVSIALDPSADAGKATGAMMAPQNGAVFKRKQGLVLWRLPELVVSSGQQKLLARFVTEGRQARPGHVEAKWELAGVTASRLGVSSLRGVGRSNDATDPFADDGTTPASPARSWNEVPTVRSLISGRYSAS